MSKKRPRAVVAKQRELVNRFTEEYWRTRVFRNTYTHRGRRFVVGRWSVKIQIAGVRKTFSLASSEKDSAAREALLLYQRLAKRVDRSQDPGADSRVSDSGQLPAPTSPLAAAGNRNLAAYWKPRLIRRKYVGRLPGRSDAEWSVLIEHKSERAYFPLGTSDEDEAALASAERFSVVNSHGWNQARLSFFREITVGVIWAANPFACTYTTVLAIPATEPGNAPSLEEVRDRRLPVILVENDYGIRRAMSHWLSRQQLASTKVLAVQPPEAETAIKANPGALTLVNIGLVNSKGDPMHRVLSENCPEADVFGFGVFEDSDHIFASLSGITGGYLLRRRSPELLLEPVWSAGGRARGEGNSAALRARRYFERLFDAPDSPPVESEARLLTGREYEILSCLSKGYQDKEIADRLGISIWTVHSHLRKIFVKYGVHSRTEAVVKYLHL